jgi:hypothetical protein
MSLEENINRSKTKKTKPPKRYRSTRDYDFLQYIRPVFRWAQDNSDLTTGELHMILYLYPQGVFTRTTFFDYQRTISIKQQLVFKSLIERGWIKVWSPKTRKQATLYALTNKSKRLCDKMHKVLVGDADLPVTTKHNKTASKDKAINKYFIQMMKKMNGENKDIRKRREEY